MGDNAFLHACIRGHTGVVRELLALRGERRVDTFASRGEALEEAYNANHVDIMRLLLALKPPHSLYMRFLDGFPIVSCHRQVASNCAPPDDTIRSVLFWQPGDGIPAGADTQLMLQLACHCGVLGLVRQLLALEGGAQVDVHASDNLALHEALLNGHGDIAEELCKLTGARAPKARCIDLGTFEGARQAGHASVLPIALVRLRDARWIRGELLGGICDSCRDGQVECLRVLLDMSMHLSNGRGAIPFNAWRAACQGGHPAVLQLLAEQRGASALRLVELEAGGSYYEISNQEPLDDQFVYDSDEEDPGEPEHRGSGMSLASLFDRGDFVRALLLLLDAYDADMVHADDDLALRRACAADASSTAQVLLEHTDKWGGMPEGVIRECLCIAWAGPGQRAALELYKAMPLGLPLQYCLHAAAQRWSGLHVAVPDHAAAALVEPPLAGLVVQHVLVWLLEKHLQWTKVLSDDGSLSNLFFFDVFALCTVLPAARRSPEVSAALQRAVMQTQPYQRLLWSGMCVPVAAIRGAPADAALGGLLRRSGRRGMLLHRAAARGAARARKRHKHAA